MYTLLLARGLARESPSKSPAPSSSRDSGPRRRRSRLAASPPASSFKMSQWHSREARMRRHYSARGANLSILPVHLFFPLLDKPYLAGASRALHARPAGSREGGNRGCNLW